jgi:hypothetical protein
MSPVVGGSVEQAVREAHLQQRRSGRAACTGHRQFSVRAGQRTLFKEPTMTDAIMNFRALVEKAVRCRKACERPVRDRPDRSPRRAASVPFVFPSWPNPPIPSQSSESEDIPHRNSDFFNTIGEEWTFTANRPFGGNSFRRIPTVLPIKTTSAWALT